MLLKSAVDPNRAPLAILYIAASVRNTADSKTWWWYCTLAITQLRAQAFTALHSPLVPFA